MKSNPIVWFEIYVQDLARARKFYETVFEKKLEELKSPASIDTPGLQMLSFPADMNATGAAGALAKMDGVPSGCGGTLVYFACEDCAVEEGRVAKAGGRIERRKMSIGQYGHISLVFDTEGNMIGLHSMK
jgi:predicted enzyme related to lactoylglutathione lyase